MYAISIITQRWSTDLILSHGWHPKLYPQYTVQQLKQVCFTFLNLHSLNPDYYFFLKNQIYSADKNFQYKNVMQIFKASYFKRESFERWHICVFTLNYLSFYYHDLIVLLAFYSTPFFAIIFQTFGGLISLQAWAAVATKHVTYSLLKKKKKYDCFCSLWRSKLIFREKCSALLSQHPQHTRFPFKSHIFHSSANCSTS